MTRQPSSNFYETATQAVFFSSSLYLRLSFLKWLQVFRRIKNDVRLWNGIFFPFHYWLTRTAVCWQRQKNRTSFGWMFPPLAFPLTVLWTLRPEHTWVFNSPGHSREPTLPPPKHKPQREISLQREEWSKLCCLPIFKAGCVCHDFWEGARSDWGVGPVCSQVLVVRKSLKCSKCGSQVRMVRNMPVIISLFFQSALPCLFLKLNVFVFSVEYSFFSPHFFFILISCKFEP